MSRERFGKEFEGMLKKSLPRGLRLLHDMHILPLLLTEDPAATAAAASADAEAAAASAASDAAAPADGSSTTTTSAPAVVSATGPSEEAWATMLEVSAWLEEAMHHTGSVPFMAEAGTEAANNSNAQGGGNKGGGGSPKIAQKSGKGSPASSPSEKAPADTNNNKDAVSASTAAFAVAPEAVQLQRRRSALLASAVLPFQGRTLAVGKKKFMPGAQAALQEGLKTTLKDAEQSAALVEAVPQLRALAARLSNSSSSSSSSKSSGSDNSGGGVARSDAGAQRLEVGRLLTSLKALWRPALALALASELQAALGPCPSSTSVGAGKGASPMNEETVKDVVARFEAVASTVRDLNLDGCWSVKPMLNGKELGALLELPLGPKVGEAMREQALWQLEHPDGNKDECLAALRTRMGQ